ncbi:hypothetical protein ACFWPU_14835 [Streptomyces sp. NPDC058471]|uniref:hypothetical protein n=1 Tax=Streptomyces sp. NPDC058471 TaxID=3346516 RepID=UPI0036552552
MHHTEPPGILAPHIPADAYRRAEATGAPVVIVVQTTTPRAARPARTYLIPLAIAGAAVLGLFGLVATFLALLDFATQTAIAVGGAAGPIGVGGITLRLFHPKTK